MHTTHVVRLLLELLLVVVSELLCRSSLALALLPVALLLLSLVRALLPPLLPLPLPRGWRMTSFPAATAPSINSMLLIRLWVSLRVSRLSVRSWIASNTSGSALLPPSLLPAGTAASTSTSCRAAVNPSILMTDLTPAACVAADAAAVNTVAAVSPAAAASDTAVPVAAAADAARLGPTCPPMVAACGGALRATLCPTSNPTAACDSPPLPAASATAAAAAAGV
jgi:hypothetical protein